MNYAETIAFLDNARLLIEAIKAAGIHEPDITVEAEEICMEWYEGGGKYARCDISRKKSHIYHSHKNVDAFYNLNDHAAIITKIKELM